MNKKQITALALTTVMAGTTLSGCFGGSDPVYEFVGVVGYTEEYDVGDQFSYAGIKLKFKEQGKNNYKLVDVTEEMIKAMPDLSTSGEKEIVIKYNGKEYSFTITVNAQTGEEEGGQELTQRFLEYLQNYQNGSINKILGSYNVNLDTKFLNENALVDESGNFEFNKSELSLLATTDQQKFAKTIYEAITDSLVKSGFNIEEESSKYNVNLESVMQSLNERLINKTVQDELFYALFPQGIDAFCMDIVSNISNVLGISSTAVKLTLQQKVKEVVVSLYNGDFETANQSINYIFGMLSNENYTSYFREVERVYSIYNSLTSESPNKTLSNFVKAFVDGDSLIVVNQSNEEVSNASINSKKTNYRNALINLAKAYENILFSGFGNIKTELKNISGYYKLMGDIVKTLQENDYSLKIYTGVEGSTGYSDFGDYANFYLLSSYANLYSEICALAESFTVEQDEILILEKTIFMGLGYMSAMVYNMHTIKGEIQIHNPEDPIYVSVPNGTETIKTVTVAINTQNLINEMGDCVLKITGLEELILTQELLDNYEINDFYEIHLTENGSYYIEIVDLEGRLQYSSYFVKNDPYQFLWREKLEDTIENIDNVAKYIKVLSAEDEQQMIEFISELVDKDIYIENYNEYKTPYFITEIVKNNFINSENSEGNGEYKDKLLEVITTLTKYVDELKLKYRDGEDVGIGLINAVADFGQAVIDLNKEYEIEYSGKPFCAILSILHTELEHKERVTKLFENLDKAIEDVVYETVFAQMGLFDEAEEVEVKVIIRENADILLNGSASDFALFEQIVQKMVAKVEISDEVILEKFSVSAVNLASGLDQFIINGDKEALKTVIANNYLSLLYGANNPIGNMLVDLVDNFGYDMPSIINGALNSEEYKSNIEGLIATAIGYVVSGRYNIELSNELMESVMTNFVAPLMDSLKQGNDYEINSLTPLNFFTNYYNLLEELEVNYNEDAKNIFLEIANEETGTFAENLINVLNDNNKRNKISKYFVEVLKIEDNNGEVAEFIDGFIFDSMHNQLELDSKIDEFVTILDNKGATVGVCALTEIGLKVLNSVVTDCTNGNFSYETIRVVLSDYMEQSESASMLPSQIQLILTVLSSSVSEPMSYVAKVLENEFAYNNCVTALTEAICAFDSNLFTFKDAVDENFSKEVLNYIILNKNINSGVILNLYNNTIDCINLENNSEYTSNMAVELILTLLKNNGNLSSEDNLKQNLIEFVNNNKTSIAKGLASTLIAPIANPDILEQAYSDATKLLVGFIDIVLENNDNVDKVLADAKLFSDTYYGKDVTTAIGASVAVITIMCGNENIDYNKLFSFVDLPEGVSVDYNVLIAKLKDSATWEDCIKITEMTYTINENSLKDNWVSQTYNVTISLDFDVQIAKVQGDIKFTFNLEK